RRALAAADPAQPPLPEEQCAFIEQPGVVGRRHALDDPAAPEWWHRHLDIGCDVRPRGHLDRLLVGFAFSGNTFRPLVPGLALGLLLARRDGLRTAGVDRA